MCSFSYISTIGLQCKGKCLTSLLLLWRLDLYYTNNLTTVTTVCLCFSTLQSGVLKEMLANVVTHHHNIRT